LLRFVQDHEYERVGEVQTRRADVRIISATNVDLEAAARDGSFREDLLYRIKVMQIDLPALRDRPEDIVALATRFLAEFGRASAVVGFTDQAQEALRRYSWPGNVRELRNVIERAAILYHGESIGLEHLPSSFAAEQQKTALEVGDLISLDQLEEEHIRRILAKAKSLDEAATILGIDVATLWRRRKKYGI
jgi:NtrC-family two-component system response regulator AlgB